VYSCWLNLVRHIHSVRFRPEMKNDLAGLFF
jgi:hypothetical protein